MCQGFSHNSRFLHNFAMAKLATSSIKDKEDLPSSEEDVVCMATWKVSSERRIGIIDEQHAHGSEFTMPFVNNL